MEKPRISPLVRMLLLLVTVVCVAAQSIAQQFPTKPPIPGGPKAPQQHMRSLTNAQRKAAAVRAARFRAAALAQGKSVVPDRKGGKK
jgi:hypothetical protein